MIEFVRIEKFFDNERERTLDHLANVYKERSMLKEKMIKAGQGILDNESLIKGKKILLKPNWVRHNLCNEDQVCLRTHDSFLLAALDVLLEKKPESIVVGDAPIQGCKWDKIWDDGFLKEIYRLSTHYAVPIKIMDFRRVTFDPTKNNPIKNRHPLSEYIIYDLGEDSYLEPISSENNIFRVNNYDPDRLAESHSKGIHKYCITKEIFEADLVVSLPKIKTHQKTGITGALKNLVGLNGDKDYLPHHRVGGSGFGGDCYPGKNILRRIAEFAKDYADKNQGKKIYWAWLYSGLILWRLSFPQKVHSLAAGWYGNDTCWRMVMDLNKILIYGKNDGSLSNSPQREIYSLCDGIIAGQGDGPLYPSPLGLGMMSFTNNNLINDVCMATLMGFDVQKIPLLREVLKNTQSQDCVISLNGEKKNIADLTDYAIQATPPQGWIDYLGK